MINKVTPRKRNSETDSRYVTPDQYTDAVNVRASQSFTEQGGTIPSANAGVLKPVKGTTSVAGMPSNGYVLGKIVDQRNGRLYMAVWAPDSASNGVYVLEQGGTVVKSVVASSFFAWSGDSHVDMTLTYKSLNPNDSDSEPIIYMTDNENEPMKVDVGFFENNDLTAASGRLYDAITVCTPTPQERIVTAFGFQQGTVNLSTKSNFRNLPGMQFAYQNIHETGEISPLSTYSELAVPPGYLLQGAATQDKVDNYNTIQIDIPAQTTSVEKVRLLARFGEDGAWLIVDEIDHSGSSLTYYFSNNEVLPLLPSLQANRQFESVPQFAATNEIVEDRMFYGNYVEGYPNTPVTANLAVVYNERPNDFISVDLQVDSIMAQVNSYDGTGNSLDNRMASFKLTASAGDDTVIPAGSTVNFDLTFAPDKNLHLYESSKSFHPNNELYDYNEGSYAGNVNTTSFPDPKKLADGCYAPGPGRVLSIGTSLGVRMGVSDDIITGEGPKWEVKAGPNEGEEYDVVYGTSPANPLIFKGGEMKFVIRFNTLLDVTPTQIVDLIQNAFDGDDTGFLAQTDADGTVIPAARYAEFLETKGTSQYSYDLGLQNRRKVSRGSSVTDLICHCGIRNDVLALSDAFDTENTNDFTVIPTGYFVVNKATLDFSLKKLDNDALSGVTVGEGEAYFGVNLSKVVDYDLFTMVPVFTGGVGGFDNPDSAPTYNSITNPWLYKGSDFGSGSSDGTADDFDDFYEDIYPLAEHTTIRHWVSLNPNGAGASMSDAVAQELFTYGGFNRGTQVYQAILSYGNGEASDDALDAVNTVGNRSPKLNWFGKLKTANTTFSEALAQVGGTGGGGGLVETPGDLVVPWDVFCERDGQDPSSSVAYAKYAFSVIDGEGGIGGYKGDVAETAVAWANEVAKEHSYWSDEAEEDQVFVESEVRQAMGGYGGKIHGSVPSSIVVTGKGLVANVRVVPDIRGESAELVGAVDDLLVVRPYPESAPLLGPTLYGFSMPFQYMAPYKYTSELEGAGSELLLDGNIADLSDEMLAVVNAYSVLSDADAEEIGTDNVALANAAGYLRINSDAGGFDEQPSSMEVISDNTFVLSSQEDVSGFRSFKRYATHDLGIVYYDRFGRSSNVNPLPSAYVAGYSPAEQTDAGSATPQQGATSLAVKLTSDPPEWAFNYRFVYAGNNTVDDFLQYSSGGAFVAVNEDDEDNLGNIFVSLNYLQENTDVSFANAFGAVSDEGDKQLYKYRAGDRLRVISHFVDESIGGRVFPNNFDFEVVGIATLGDNADNPLHAAEDGDVPNFKQGQFVVLRNNPNAAGFSYTAVRSGNNSPEATTHKWNDRTIFEIYSPSAQAGEGERAYYEIGDVYDVIEDESGNLKHEYDDHLITEGDVWFRRTAVNLARYRFSKFRNIIKGEAASTPRFLDYYVESPRFSDLVRGSGVTGKGKAKIYLSDSETVRRDSSVIFSDVNNPAAKYNKFSTFDATSSNFKNLPNEHGDIDLLHKDGDSLVVFQKTKTSFLPINRSVISDASNTASLIASAKVIGTQVFVKGSYGTGGSPEAVVYVDGVFYFANADRREVYMYQPGGGVKVISDMGMKDYFDNLFSSQANPRIVTGFDYQNDEFLIDVVSQPTLTYSTNPVVPSVDTGTVSTEAGVPAGITFQEFGVTGITQAEFEAVTATNEGLQTQIDGLNATVQDLQDALNSAFNDIDTTVVIVDGGVQPTDEEDATSFDFTNIIVSAATALIRAQESGHLRVYEFALGAENTYPENGGSPLIYNSDPSYPPVGEGTDLWTRLGIDSPHTGDSAVSAAKEDFDLFKSTVGSAATLFYDDTQLTWSFLSPDTNTSTGFGITYTVGYGAGIDEANIDLDTLGLSLPSGATEQDIADVLALFPSPADGSYLSFGSEFDETESLVPDYDLSNITVAISGYLSARNTYIQAINAYIEAQLGTILEDSQTKDQTILDLTGDLDDLQDQYFNDIQALAEVITRIPNPDENVAGNSVLITSSFINKAGGLGPGNTSFVDFDDMIASRPSNGLVTQSNNSIFQLSNAIQDQVEALRAGDQASISSLLAQRNVLATQIQELVKGVGQGFEDQSGTAFSFEDPVIEAIYNSEGGPADIIDIISSQAGSDTILPNVLDDNDLVGSTAITFATAGDVIDVLANIAEAQSLGDKFVETGLDDAIETLISAVVTVAEEGGGGTITSTEDDLYPLTELTAEEIVNQITNATEGEVSLVAQINAISNVLTSATPVRQAAGELSGRYSVASKLELLRAFFSELQHILVGAVDTVRSQTLGARPSTINGYPVSIVDMDASQSDTSYTGFLGTQTSVALQQSVSNIAALGAQIQENVSDGSAQFLRSIVSGSLNKGFDQLATTNLLNDVMYVVNRLTGFQKGLGSTSEFDLDGFASNDNAVLGKDGLQFDAVTDLNDTMSNYDGDDVSSIYGVRFLIEALADKVTQNTQDFSVTTPAGDLVQLSSLGPVGSVSSLFTLPVVANIQSEIAENDPSGLFYNPSTTET